MIPEEVIVTIQTDSGSFAADFSLPTAISMEKFTGLLLEALKKRDVRQFGSWKGLKLYRKGFLLRESKTLADYCVWDGSILTVRENQR